jgi:hypothetical protein
VRQGCGCGCLTLVFGGLLVIGAVWYGTGMFGQADVGYEVGSPADGRRAQQKLFELAGRMASRRDSKPVVVTLSEREINSFLVRHVPDQLPLAEATVHLVGNGVVEIAGRVPLRSVLGDSLGAATRALPQQWGAQPVRIRLRGPLRLESGTARPGPRRLRIEVESLWIGRRRVPALVLTILPDGPLLRATRWPVSPSIESVVVEPGRLTVTSRP